MTTCVTMKTPAVEVHSRRLTSIACLLGFIKVLRKKGGGGATTTFFIDTILVCIIHINSWHLTTCVQIDIRSLVRYGLDGKLHASASLCIFRRTILYLVDTSIKRALAGV